MLYFRYGEKKKKNFTKDIGNFMGQFNIAHFSKCINFLVLYNCKKSIYNM